MSLTIGIIGLPQSGKSTLFQALTRMNADVSSASSQKPNLARVNVPDARLDALSRIYSPKKTTATTVDFVDVAATLSGGDDQKGELGKRVLGQFRTVDTLLEVVRCFEHPYLGGARPQSDLETLELEKLISDLTVIQNTLDRNKKLPADARAFFESIARPLEEGRRPDAALLDAPPASAKPMLMSMALLIAKPSIICANIPEDALGSEDSFGPWKEVQAHAQEHGVEAFSVCARTEAELSQMSPEEAAEFMKELGIKESSLDKLIRASYHSLNLITFFTAGEDECRAWTVRNGAFAPEAAGKIHSDLEKGFIRAEVTRVDDLISLGSTAACRDKGLLRLEGKTYPVVDGDVMEIRFNV
ncbi:MAG: redox-regulated ATPase YchF [Candidatus Xenobia bacterium]